MIRVALSVSRVAGACVAVLLAAGFFERAEGQSPLGTAFTYQGRLKDGGGPANGQYDMQFKLFDDVGTPVGSTICRDNVQVTDGLFTVSLDFGAQFNGIQRLIEIGVRAGGPPGDCGMGVYTTLAPRQALTAAPNALFALNASTATTATTAANATQLNGQPAAFYQNASNINSGTLADARLSSNVALLNAAQTFTGAKTFSIAPAFTAAGSPFSVTATGLVTNLNADRLDGVLAGNSRAADAERDERHAHHPGRERLCGQLLFRRVWPCNRPHRQILRRGGPEQQPRGTRRLRLRAGRHRRHLRRLVRER